MERSSYNYIEPTGKKKPSFYLPTEFEEKVISHILKNYVAHTGNINIPLILAIQGAQGDGKSSQVREACSRRGIYVYPISGSFLSGSHEKEAVDFLAKAYVNAYSLSKETRRLVTLLIDDFDLSVASTFENCEYTVNSQLLAGFLMNLADDPSRCGQERVSRIPIIVTGNNFTALYRPLTRHGRMDFFTWCPTNEQKLEIIMHMYESCVKKNEMQQIYDLVYEFIEQPIAFFDALKSDYLDTVICQKIRKGENLSLSEIEQVSKRIFSQGINPVYLKQLALNRKVMEGGNYIKRLIGQSTRTPPLLPGQRE